MSCSKNSSTENFDVFRFISPNQSRSKAYTPLAYPETVKSYPAEWPTRRTCFDLFSHNAYVKKGMYPSLDLKITDALPIYDGYNPKDNTDPNRTFTCPKCTCRLGK